MPTRVFDIPSSSGSLWVSLLLLIPIAIIAVLAVIFWPRPLSIEVSGGAIVLRGSVYGRSIPVSDLRLDLARVVDLEHSPELRFKYRTNGVRLPNYHVGWFRLRNGERALCMLTTGKSAAYVPTKQNFVMLLGVSDPGELLSALRQGGAQDPG